MKRLPTKNPDVVFQRLDEGGVLLSTQSEVYFGLDPVGAVIWELLPPNLEALDTLLEALGDRYPEVAPATLRTDALEFLKALVEAGLAQIRDESGD